MSIVTADVLVDGLKNIAESEALQAGIASNWFGDLVRYCDDSNLQSLNCRKEVGAYLKEQIEARYKEETGEKSMPSAYRSSKSVVSKAIELKVTLFRTDGEPKGKTELEQEMKEMTADKSVDDKIADLASTISKLLDKGEHTNVSAELLVNLGIKASS